MINHRLTAEIWRTDESEDLSRKWCGTYIRVNNLPYYIEEVIDWREPGCFQFVGYSYMGEQGRKELVFHPFDTDLVVDPSFPATGLFKVGQCMYYFSRAHNRQWRLGLTKGNSALLEIQTDVRAFLRYPHIRPWEDPHKASLWHREYTDDPIGKVWRGESHLEAISPDIWVGFDLQYHHPVIGFLDNVLGEVINPEQEVKLFEESEFLVPSLTKIGVTVV